MYLLYFNLINRNYLRRKTHLFLLFFAFTIIIRLYSQKMIIIKTFNNDKSKPHAKSV